MTIGIAVTFDLSHPNSKKRQSGLILVSDRALSNLHTNKKSEPVRSKVWTFSESCFALMCDDMELQHELCEDTDRMLTARFPEGGFTVDNVKDTYLEAFDNARNARLDQQVLSRYKLTTETFADRSAKGEIHKSLNGRLFETILDFRLKRNFETIIAGVDDGKAQIWRIICDGRPNSDPELDWDRHTDNGYSVIGIGRSDVETQFDLAQYHRWMHSTDIMLLAFSAKRRVEDVDGVGRKTDILLVNPDGTNLWIPDQIQLWLQKEFDLVENNIAEEQQRSAQRLREFIAKHNEKPKEPKTAKSTTNGTKPTTRTAKPKPKRNGKRSEKS